MSSELATPTAEAPTASLPPEVVHTGQQWAVRTGLAGALDALVRSMRSGGATAETLADRLRTAWLAQRDVQLEIQPSGMSIDGRTALAAEEQVARWTLPLFMVGVRRIGIHPQVEAVDLVHFAEMVGRLDHEEERLRAFLDWVWEDGAEGMKLELQVSFVEMLERTETVVEPAAQATSEAVRSRAALPVGVTHPIDASELSRAVLRPELQVDIGTYAESVQARRFELTGDDMKLLAGAATDSAAWSRAELLCLLELPELRSVVEPRDVVRRLVQWLREPPNADAARLLTEILLATDPGAMRLAKALDPSITADAVVAGTGFNESPKPLARLLTVGPAALAREILHRLLGVAAERDDAQVFLAQLALDHEPARWCEVWDWARIGAREAAVLVDVLTVLRLEALLTTMLERIAPDASAAALMRMPADKMLGHRTVIDRVTRTRGDGASAVLRQMCSTNAEGARAIVTELLLAHETVSWSPNEFGRACRFIATEEAGRDVLVQLCRSLKLAPTLRLSALAALRGDDARLARATRWRLYELFDAREVRTAFRHARTTSAGARKAEPDE